MTCKKECMEQKKDGTLKPCIVMKDNTTLRSVKENLEKENEQLKKENARLSKMLEMAINDTIRKGNQCFYCKDNYTKDICDNCTEENRINVMKLYRTELENRVENEK